MRTLTRPGRGALCALGAIALLVIALPTFAFAARTISLSAGKVELSLSPGQVAHERLSVANTADETVTAFVYTANAVPKSDGQMDYKRPDPNDPVLDSPAQWVALKIPEGTKTLANTPYLELSPDEEIVIEYDVQVPSNAPPGDYNAIIFFEMFDRDSAAAGNAATVSGRIGTRVRTRVVGQIRDSLLTQPFIARTLVIGDKAPFSLAVTNNGNVDNTATVTLELVAAGENVVWDQSLDKDVIIYAGTDRVYEGAVQFSGAGPGRYTFRAVAQYAQEADGGAAEEQTAMVERTVWILPLWLAIALLVIVGVFVAWLVWRFSPKGGKPPAKAEAPPTA